MRVSEQKGSPVHKIFKRNLANVQDIVQLNALQTNIPDMRLHLINMSKHQKKLFPLCL